jgi:di/tricarboxylate transporter
MIMAKSLDIVFEGTMAFMLICCLLILICGWAVDYVYQPLKKFAGHFMGKQKTKKRWNDIYYDVYRKRLY